MSYRPLKHEELLAIAGQVMVCDRWHRATQLALDLFGPSVSTISAIVGTSYTDEGFVAISRGLSGR